MLLVDNKDEDGDARAAFLIMAREAALILVKSVPRIMGLFEIAQMPKWERSSAVVRTPLPISCNC